MRCLGGLDVGRVPESWTDRCGELQASDLSRLLEVVQSWAKLDTAGVWKAAKRLGMSADPGPTIPGYVDEHFQNAEPSGVEVEASAPGSVGNDLPNED